MRPWTRPEVQLRQVGGVLWLELGEQPVQLAAQPRRIRDCVLALGRQHVERRRLVVGRHGWQPRLAPNEVGRRPTGDEVLRRSPGRSPMLFRCHSRTPHPVPLPSA